MPSRTMTQFVVALLTLPILHGCSAGTGGGGGGEDVILDFEDTGDGDTGNALDDQAAALLDELLESGTDPVDALRELSEDLADEPGVRGVEMNQDQAELWVVYDSGEQVLFSVETLDDTFVDAAGFGGFDDQDFIDAAKLAAPGRTQTRQPTDDLIPGLTTSLYVFPDSSKALLINSIRACVDDIRFDDYDATKGIARLLQRIGYTSDRSTGSLEVFKTLTDYGLVFIESRTSSQTIKDLFDIGLPDNPGQTGDPPPNADFDGNNEVIVTSTRVTRKLRTETYADDLRFGRLKIRHARYVAQGRVFGCEPTFAVTPNFIRQHNKDRFPNHTLLYISAGRLIDESEMTSQWQALLEEKSDNGHFMSWVGKPKYSVTKLAAANVFELLTGAKFQYKLRTTTTTIPGRAPIINDELNTADVTPPMANQGIGSMLVALTLNGDTIDLNTGAFFLHTSHGPQTQAQQLALAPVFSDFFIDQLGRAQAHGGAPAGSQARFIDAGVGYDLGAHGPPEIDNSGIVFAGWGYHFNVPVGIAETLQLQEPLGRHSSTRTVYTWKPILSISGQGPDGEQYTMSIQLVVRAVPAPRSRGTVNPLDPYSAPSTHAFDGRFDGTASTITWSVSGTRTVGQFRDDYSGGGLAQLNFEDEDGWPVNATFSTLDTDGESITIDLDIETEMSYTRTRTDNSNSQTTVTERTLPNPIMLLTGLGIDDTLTLQAGSRSVNFSEWTATIRWSDVAPSPAFHTYSGSR